MERIICVIGNKGGTGKTSITHMLCHGLGLLGKRSIAVLTDAARTWLAEKGYDRSNGARPMARLIQSKIKEPLASELLFGSLQGGGKVVIGEKEGELTLSYTGN